MRWLAKFIYFRIFGWKIVGNTNFSKDTVNKAVIISAPHTSNYDFFIGIFLRKITGVKTNFVAKKELFTVINSEIIPIREKYFELNAQPDLLNDLFADGARKVRPQAQELIEKLRDLVGISKIV